ncbi:hypothetical protein PTKIN_Ptkin09bG0107400 [Pterospermum kingtungense]
MLVAASATSPAVGSFYISRSIKEQPRLRIAVRSSAISVATILTKLQKDCATPLPVLRHVADSMSADMRAGLDVDGCSDLKMILSYVDSLPTGYVPKGYIVERNEKGLFYALDLGGTNFRVLRVQLGGKDERLIPTEFEQVSIPQELMFATSEELFDFIASVLANFATKEGGKFHLPPGRKREIGFTFSFPVNQTSIDSGILIKWTKGFAVSGTAGKDVIACLNEAMDRKGLDMRVSTLVNDAVGTLVGARYWDDDVVVAVILGTGTNACYVERMDAIPKAKLLGDFSPSGSMASATPAPQTHPRVHSQPLHAFHATVQAVHHLHLAPHPPCTKESLPQHPSPYQLGTPDLSAMLQDNTDDLHTVGSTLYDVLGVESNLNSRKIVLEVCDTIVKRAGRLAGAGIVGILQKIEEDSKGAIFGKRTVVAMDGGLNEHYPQYRRYLKEAVAELLGPETSLNIVMEHSKDGSGIGAALLAATYSKYEHNQ